MAENDFARNVISNREGPWFKYRALATAEFRETEELPEDDGPNLDKSALYERFKLGSDQFRLIKLLPGVFHDPINFEFIVQNRDTELKYTALSYCWGDVALTQIMIHESQLRVSPRVSDALRRLRLSDDYILLWVDAICINQQDDAEKAEQVQAMREIYEGADEVVVWLGDGPEYECISAIHHFFQLARNSLCLHSEPGSCESCAARVVENIYECFPDMDGWENFAIVFFDEWWNRTWVVQELLVAKTVWILQGPASIRWEVFEMAMDFLSDIYRQLVRSGFVTKGVTTSSETPAIVETRTPTVEETAIPTAEGTAIPTVEEAGTPAVEEAMAIFKDSVGRLGEHESDSSSNSPSEGTVICRRIQTVIETQYNSWLKAARQKFQHEGGFDLLKLLLDTWRLQATDPRDKIFGIYHLIKGSLPPSLIPDYGKPVSLVYKLVVQHLITETKSLDVLLITYPNEGSHMSLPSWCPNWSSEPVGYSDIYRNMRFQARLDFGRKSQSEYAATRKSSTAAQFNDDLKLLTLRGARLDEITFAKRIGELSEKNSMETILESIPEMMRADIVDSNTIFQPYAYGGNFLEVWRRLMLPDVSGIPDIAEKNEALHKGLISTVSGKHIFVTKSRLLGFAFSPIQKDDIVCLLFGGKTPFILRQHSSTSEDTTTFKLIGSCYVEGVMNGILVDPERPNRFFGTLKEKDFILQ